MVENNDRYQFISINTNLYWFQSVRYIGMYQLELVFKNMDRSNQNIVGDIWASYFFFIHFFNIL